MGAVWGAVVALGIIFVTFLLVASRGRKDMHQTLLLSTCHRIGVDVCSLVQRVSTRGCLTLQAIPGVTECDETDFGPAGLVRAFSLAHANLAGHFSMRDISDPR